MKKVLVSSCLLGKKCAYDGKGREVMAVTELCSQFGFCDICPEIAGGLDCPREMHESTGGGEDVLGNRARVISFSGKDHTENFVRGAEKTLKVAKAHNITVAVMKAHSPSCGKGKIYGGAFNGTLCNGNGVTAALLLRDGIKVFTENEVEEARRELSFR